MTAANHPQRGSKMFNLVQSVSGKQFQVKQIDNQLSWFGRSILPRKFLQKQIKEAPKPLLEVSPLKQGTQ